MPVSTVQEYFDTLQQRFVPSASDGIEAIFQFDISGDQGGLWHVMVNDGEMKVCEGAHENPSATLSASATDYVKIANNEMNGLRAVMTRKMKIAGNLVMARTMQAMFPVGV